ncbi:hypothetical protein F2P81_011127 [Scophthalmus maximus]|uniref:Uncharacterized protein n=1 Tax=Scophthalmus maximus TaxID=52904 RepID=A0A6A4ST31_SCOMX|nr:hypothetical protein F2P81_011127 [Scophthalmus maximus]
MQQITADERPEEDIKENKSDTVLVKIMIFFFFLLLSVHPGGHKGLSGEHVFTGFTAYRINCRVQALSTSFFIVLYKNTPREAGRRLSVVRQTNTPQPHFHLPPPQTRTPLSQKERSVQCQPTVS